MKLCQLPAERGREGNFLNSLLKPLLFCSIITLLVGCKTEFVDKIVEYDLDTGEDVIQMPSGASEKSFAIESNIAGDDLKITLEEQSEEWLSYRVQDTLVYLIVTDNETGKQRKSVLTIEGKNKRKDVIVKQGAVDVNEGDFDILSVFADLSASTLKEKITKEELQRIPSLFFKKLALEIYNDTYPTEYRVAAYRPYQYPEIAAEQNKTRPYSLLDNPTGIYVDEALDEIIIFVGDTKNQDIKLHIRNFSSGDKSTETVTLYEGLNVIYPKQRGLMYIYNQTEDDIPLILESDADQQRAGEKAVKIHFYSGEVNGYFDVTKHDQNDWKDILDNYGKYDEIDVVGVHSHVIWSTNEYRKNATDIVKMTTLIDNVVDQQKEFAGLYKYDKAQANRLELRVDYDHSAAYATSYHTGYNRGYNNVFTTEEGFRNRMWVLGHEIGHINQMRPDFTWAGMTEVSNNFFALYNQKKLFGEAERLMDAKDGYEAAYTKILDVGNYWFLPEEPNNHIPKSAIFWQLYLYVVEIDGQEDFFKDLHEYYRTHESPSNDLGDLYHASVQLNFIRQVCKLSKIDFTDFFEKWGMLKVVDTSINDYGMKRMVISQEMIDDLKSEIQELNLRKPTTDVSRLTDANYKEFII